MTAAASAAQVMHARPCQADPPSDSAGCSGRADQVPAHQEGGAAGQEAAARARHRPAVCIPVEHVRMVGLLLFASAVMLCSEYVAMKAKLAGVAAVMSWLSSIA